MITVRYIDSDTIKILNGDKCVAFVYGDHDLKRGDVFQVKQIAVDSDKLRVEVERPLSLVEAVGDYHGFSLNYSTNGYSKQKRAMYAAWKREVEKEKT